ncbi:Aste57867_21082 [Aphanomyces stellatus]|uniref:Aste57867_21082 protein n=1 Tax=Aphanomyces stellatus TaxID=120398 RepID=A0A485LHB2_9STRA|nr:hypothetical protein As57867_021014 [Aphanomyces stellatus]VFT97756.1 Aste57867_21082 [Aphanomyces stellatus]
MANEHRRFAPTLSPRDDFMVRLTKFTQALRRATLNTRARARFSTSAAVSRAEEEEDPIANFQLLLEKRQPNAALRIFQSLPKPPSTDLSQRLAIMLAKKANMEETKNALEVLKSVYMNPALQPDDFTKLAFIFVSDACYRNKMIQEALEVTEEAHNLGVRLDLPAYNNLINALVESDQVEEALLILQDIAAGDVISPDETTYAGLVGAIISQREFARALEIIDQARTSGVKFSGSAYMTFMSLLQEVEDDSIAMEKLLSYMDICMEEDGVEMAFAEFDDAFNVLHDEDDDDDGDDEDGNGDDDDSDDDDRKH